MAGEGAIYRRTRTGPDGRPYTRWMAQVSIGPRGQRRQITRVARTRTEAKALLAELLDDLRAGTSPSRLPLGSYLRSWLDETVRPSVRPNTIRGYEDAIAHLAPIAHIPLAELTAENVERTINRMEARRYRQKKDAEPASPKTQRNALVVLRAALAQAERRGHVRRNVAKDVPVPRVERHEPEAMTVEDAKAILEAVSGDRYEAAYILGLLSLRSGEVLGLAWSDVDEEAATLTIRYQLVGSGPTAARALPKTRRSARRIHLPPFALRALLEHRARQRLERIASGRSTEEGLIFVTERGYAVNGSWLTKHYQALLEAAGLPRSRRHDLRHGTASLLAALGVHPKVAADILGHTTERMTLGTYTHVTSDQQREAMERLGKAMEK